MNAIGSMRKCFNSTKTKMRNRGDLRCGNIFMPRGIRISNIPQIMEVREQLLLLIDDTIDPVSLSLLNELDERRV